MNEFESADGAFVVHADGWETFARSGEFTDADLLELEELIPAMILARSAAKENDRYGEQ